MIIASKKPTILASQINTGGKPVVLPPPTLTPLGGSIGGAATTPGKTATTTTTNTPVTNTPLSGSTVLEQNSSSAALPSISQEGERNYEYYFKRYWYVPVALVILYLGNKKYRWF